MERNTETISVRSRVNTRKTRAMILIIIHKHADEKIACSAGPPTKTMRDIVETKTC